MKSPAHICIFSKVASILVRDRMDITRLGLIFGSLLWAFFLILPVPLFPTMEQISSGGGRVTYTVMALIAPENLWALLFLINAIATAYSLFYKVRSRITLLLDGVLGCVLWTGSTVACFAAHWPLLDGFFASLAAYPPPAAMSGEIVMAFYSWWHMIRHWAEEPTNQQTAMEDGNG